MNQVRTYSALSLIPALSAIFCAGCATTVTSVPLSREAAQDLRKGAIPYYLPKPYLLVSRNFSSAGNKTSKTTKKEIEGGKSSETTTETTEPAVTANTNGATYSYQFIYLPDLRKKYGLSFRRGSGSYETSFTLVDGWKFTGLNVKGDAKTAETIQASGEFIKSLASAGGDVFKLLNPQAFLPLANIGTAESVGPEEPRIWLFEIDDNMNFKLVHEWGPTALLGGTAQVNRKSQRGRKSQSAVQPQPATEELLMPEPGK